MRERVLLLHGFTQTGASWDSVVRALPQRYTPLAPDLPGHGALAERRPVTLEATVAYVRALAREQPFALAGYSMGGRLALHTALALPALITRLVLVSASPGLADAAERERRRAADEQLARHIAEVGTATFAREWEAQPLFAGMPAQAVAVARRERARQQPAGLAAALRGLGTGALPSLWDSLGEVRTPVVLLAGERDAKFRAIAAEMARALPRARLEVVPCSGHAVHLEAPEAVAAALA